MASLNTIVVTILANGQQYVSTLRSMAGQTQAAATQMQAAMTKAAGATDKATKSTTSLSHSMTNMAKEVVGNIARFAGYFVAVGAISNAVGGAVNELRNFDAQMRNIQSITLDTDEATRGLAESLLKMVLSGESAGQSAGKMAENMYQIVQAGYDAAEAMRIAGVAAVGASAGQTSAAVAGKALVAILQSYKLPVEQVDMVMSHLFTIVDKGVITFEELATNLGYVVPSASGLGVTLSELGAAIEYLTRQGQMPSRTMTNLNQLLTNLLDPSEKLAKAIKKIGYESGAAMVQELGLVGAIAALGKHAGVTDGEISALGKSGRDLNEIVDESAFLNAEAASTLADWFGEVRAIRAILPLAANGGKHFNDMLNEHNRMALTGTRHLRALKEQQKSFNYQVTALTANIHVMVAILGSLLLPSLTALVKQFNELFKKLVVVNEETGESMFLWEKYPEKFQKVVKVLEFLATLLGMRLLLALVMLVKPFLNVFQVALAIVKLLNPWVILVTVIITLLKHFGLMDDVIRTLEETFNRVASKAIPFFQKAYETLVAKFNSTLPKIIGFVKNFVYWFTEGFSGNGWAKSSRGIDQFAMRLGSMAKTAKQKIGEIVATVERLVHMFKLGFQGLEARGFDKWQMAAYKAGQIVRKSIVWVMEVGIPNAIEIAKYAWEAFAVKIINDAKNVFKALKDFANSPFAQELFASFKEGLRLIGEALNWFATTAVPALIDAIGKISNSDAGRFFGKLVGWLFEAKIIAMLVVAAFLALTSPIGAVVVGIIALITAIGFINRHWDEFIQKVHQAWDGLPGIVRFALETVLAVATSTFIVLKGIVLTGLNMIIGTIQNFILLIRGIWNIIAGVWTGDWQRIWEGIKQVITAAWNQIKLIIETGIALLKTMLAAAWNFIKTEAGLIWDQIKDKINQVWTDIKEAIKTGINDAITAVKGFPGMIAEEIGKIAESISGAVSKIVEAGKKIGSGLVEGIAEGIGGIGTKVERMAAIIYQAIRASMNAALRKAHETLKFGFAGLKLAGKTVIPPVDFAFPLFQFWKGVRDFMGGMALVGEHGPEMMFVPPGSSIATAPKTSQIMDNMTRGGAGGSGGTGDVYAEFNVTADVDSIIRKLHEKVEELGRQLNGRSVRAGSPLNGRLG